MYKIAIVSDSHDNIPAIKQALSVIKEASVNYILHAGDFIAPFSISPFVNLGIEWKGVLGNNDGEVNGLLDKSKGAIMDKPQSISLYGKNIFLSHRPEDIPENTDNLNVVIHGHTHRHYIEKRDNVLWINPGELCGYLTGRKSFVILELDNFTLETVYF